VPLNSPDPYESITRLSKKLEGYAAVGAGTVLTVEQVERVEAAGGTLIISRGHDPDTIRQLLDQGLIRERLGHLVLTPKGTQQRRACAPF
ncbi:hypothetical protein LTR94_035866, partial [Friedmanniomyces endolithicus]